MHNIKVFLCVILLVLCSNSLFAADFIAERAHNAASFDLINTSLAYRMGYTGAGVRLGIIDEAVRPTHRDFLHNLTTYPITGNIDWSINLHGSHVGGIMVSPKDGIGMHGVAHEATLHSVAYLEDYYDENFVRQTANNAFSVTDFYNSAPNMRIVNNSLGINLFPVILDKNTSQIIDGIPQHEFLNFTLSLNDTLLYEMIMNTKHNPQVVTVFAAGNEGRISASLQSSSVRYVGLDLANFLTVGSLNAPNITKNADGSLNMTPLSISTFSNLFLGMNRYAILAPGSKVYAPNASNGDYVLQSGTSMAAPVVSGSLALVQQAYPWMTGKQLVDTVLTTANNNFQAPKFVLSLATHFGDTDPSVVERRVTFYSIDGGIASNLSQAEAAQLVHESYNNSPSFDVPLSFMLSQINIGNYEVQQISKADAFGRGVLDVGKAVQGIALLDVNRLSAEHVKRVPELGNRTYALEIFDTQGYYSTFYHDIGEEKWNDNYHHPNFQTTSTLGYNTNALALNGLSAGIIKRGVGTLMLRGDNTYGGPSIIDAGTLGLKPRNDGSGGILRNSSVVVRPQGTFYSEGGVVNNGVYNNGTVYVASTPTTALTVGQYAQNYSGKLQLEVNRNNLVNNGIYANSVRLNGSLEFLLKRSFYPSHSSVMYDVFSSARQVQGTFNSVSVWENSPTLSSISPRSMGNQKYELSITRTPNAYSQYAIKPEDESVGNALSSLAHYARDDMQTLLTSLDFSSPNGADVGNALQQLGTHTQHQLAQASFAQQGTYNSLIARNMLNNASTTQKAITNKQKAEQEPSGLSAGTTTQNNWKLWGSVLGSGSWQGGHQGFDGWHSSSVGVILGADYVWQPGMSAGIHMGYASRRLEAKSDLDATTDTQSFSMGIHSYISPKSWDGWYIMGQGRIGFDNHEHDRMIRFLDYNQSNDSKWTDFTGSLLVGGGKIWHLGNFSVGPVAWLEYSLVQRPNITESHNNMLSLDMKNSTYSSLRTALGVHLSYNTALSEKINLDINALATWRHELLEANLNTRAAFSGYESASFINTTPLMGRNTWGAQASFRLTHVDNYFLEIQLGADISDANAHNINGGIQIGYSF